MSVICGDRSLSWAERTHCLDRCPSRQVAARQSESRLNDGTRLPPGRIAFTAEAASSGNSLSLQGGRATGSVLPRAGTASWRPLTDEVGPQVRPRQPSCGRGGSRNSAASREAENRHQPARHAAPRSSPSRRHWKPPCSRSPPPPKLLTADPARRERGGYGAKAHTGRRAGLNPWG
jgi:hypothetical protein